MSKSVKKESIEDLSIEQIIERTSAKSVEQSRQILKESFPSPALYLAPKT